MVTSLSLTNLRGGEGRVDGTKLDVGVGNGSTWRLSLNIVRYTGSDSTSATRTTGGCIGGRVGGVEPEHVGVVVIPHRHDESHTASHSVAHGLESTVSFECVVVAERSLLSVAELGGYGVASHVGDRGLRVGDDFATLNVEPFDLSKRVADELGDNGEHR